MIRMDNVQPCDAVTAQIKPGDGMCFVTLGRDIVFFCRTQTPCRKIIENEKYKNKIKVRKRSFD